MTPLLFSGEYYNFKFSVERRVNYPFSNFKFFCNRSSERSGDPAKGGAIQLLYD